MSSDMVIWVCNKGTLVNNKDLRKMISAVDKQLREDVKPAHGRGARCRFLAVDDGRENVIYVFDTPDQPGALGYHDETPDGQVYGKVFASIDGQTQDLFGPSGLSVTLSHEVCELYGDRTVNIWVDMPDGKRQTCMELCDAVEGDAYPKTINGQTIHVSNFLWPDWFDPDAAGQCDQMDTTEGPFRFSTVSTGQNYMIVRNLGTGEKQIYGAAGSHLMMSMLPKHKHHIASRTMRRLSR